MNFNEVNPYIRLAMRHYWRNPNIKSRIILDYELIYCEDGGCCIQYAGHEYIIKPGNLIFICPDVEHSFISTGISFTQPHIHFDLQYNSTSDLVSVNNKNRSQLTPQELRLIRPNLFGSCSPLIQIKDRSRFLSLFYDTIDTHLSSPLTARANMIYLLDMIEHENFPGTFEGKPQSSHIGKHIKAYICDNINYPLLLDDLTKHFNYSKFYLSKIFKQEFGISIMAFYREKRMELAKQLIEHYSVSQVCEQMQFGSLCAFSRAFKQKYGITPTEYQRKLD